MTIKFMLDGYPVDHTDIGDQAYQRSWYLYDVDGSVTEFGQPAADNLQQALIAAQSLQQTRAQADIWISTDPKPPPEGWTKKSLGTDPPQMRDGRD